MPVIIGVVTPEEKTSKKVWIKQKEQVFELSVKEKPLLVRFDEGNYLLKELRFDKSLEELLYQLKNDDVIGRSWAASQLARFKDNTCAVNSLIHSAQEDEFWAVRRSALETLGKLKQREHVDLYKNMTTDKNSKVRTTALRILGDYKNPEFILFFKEQFEKDDSYMAQAEALRSIGKCGDQSQLPFLEKAVKMKSPRNVLRKAAAWAIGTVKQQK